MSNNYLQSAQEGLVFDIKEPVNSGSVLQAIGPKLENNQYWTTEDVPGQPGYFWIVSADKSLVVDIQEPVASGSPLQALVQKNEKNQWWTFTSVPGQPGYSWITSAATDSTGQALVVDIKHPVNPGSTLQALVQKNEENQWWKSVPAQPAPTPNNFGSYANYLLASDCNPLSKVQVSINVTADLVGSVGFGFQVNASSPGNNAIAWQQYCMVIGSDIQCVINNWTLPELAVAGGNPLINSWTELLTLPKSNTLPAGATLTIALANDSNSNVNSVTFSASGGGLATTSLTKKLTSISGVTQADLAPIVAFELDLVGPDDGQYTDLSSGAGTITYQASNFLTALNALPSCTESGATTGETSNSAYGQLPLLPSTTFVQTFSTRAAEPKKRTQRTNVLVRPRAT